MKCFSYVRVNMAVNETKDVEMSHKVGEEAKVLEECTLELNRKFTLNKE